MTKTLTEQWREGTLPENCYYILTKNGHIEKDRTRFCSYTDEQCFCFTVNRDIEEVLAPVPSYDEYLYLKTNNDHWNKEAIRISKQAIGIVLESDELVQKIHILEKKLEIATKALKDCYNDMKYWAVLTHRNQRMLDVIKKALKEMEGVK